MLSSLPERPRERHHHAVLSLPCVSEDLSWPNGSTRTFVTFIDMSSLSAQSGCSITKRVGIAAHGSDGPASCFDLHLSVMPRLAATPTRTIQSKTIANVAFFIFNHLVFHHDLSSLAGLHLRSRSRREARVGRNSQRPDHGRRQSTRIVSFSPRSGRLSFRQSSILSASCRRDVLIRPDSFHPCWPP